MMDTPNDRLNSFLANYGAGLNAAGGRVYSAPDAMYAGPREQASMMQTHDKLKAAAAADDPYGNMIRDLLDQANRASKPGTVALPVFPLATGSASHSYHGGGRYSD